MARAAAPASQIQVAQINNFQGGLNLKADQFNLAPNESPDLMDIVIDVTGGITQRRVVTQYGATLAATPTNIWAYTNPTVTQVVASTATNLYFSTGSTWTSITTISALPSTVRPRAAQFNNDLYVVTGSANAPIRWDGTSHASMGSSFNETIGTEGAHDGNMPKARFICAHMGKVFIAYTSEGGVDYPNRIRWSHDGYAEDWRGEDFIDIDLGRDGDWITGIVEFKDRLYVFKNNSTYVLTGYGASTFQVTALTQELGAVSQEAALVTEVGMFTFSWPEGVHLDTGNGPYPIFDKLYPLTRDGSIPPQYRYNIAMGWVNQRLWVAVPWENTATNSLCLVYNPWIWKNRYLRFLQGPWYRNSTTCGTFTTLNPPTGQTQYLASNSEGAFVGQLEQDGSVDNWGSGELPIFSYYRTRWHDLGNPSVEKRWRRPIFAVQADNANPINVEVRRDWDNTAVYRQFQLRALSSPTGMIWDDGAGTYGGKWDDGSGTIGGQWSVQTGIAESLVKGMPMGAARSIQLSFYGEGSPWGVDAIDFRFVQKRVTG